MRAIRGGRIVLGDPNVGTLVRPLQAPAQSCTAA
jgi:hypothetical protein